MEHVEELFKAVQRITIADISTLPLEQQHIIAERIEQLEDDLKKINKLRRDDNEPH